LFTNRTTFCSKSHLFPSQREWTVKQSNQSNFKVSLEQIIKIQENERQKAIVWRILQLLLPKLCCCCCFCCFVRHLLKIRMLPSPTKHKQTQTAQQIQGKKVDVSRFSVVSNEAIQELNSVAVNKYSQNTPRSIKQ